MNTHADKRSENKIHPLSDSAEHNKRESSFQFFRNRPQTLVQSKLQKTANTSPATTQLQAAQQMANASMQVQQTTQLQAIANNKAVYQQQPEEKKANNTGLPNNLKAGMESLSGMALDDVKVHRNSDKPSKLQAHAYAQGSDIHLGPGQEKHLPHEAWHVVQQKQGRVKPTMQLKGKVNVNDDAALEKEADVMGAKSLTTRV